MQKQFALLNDANKNGRFKIAATARTPDMFGTIKGDQKVLPFLEYEHPFLGTTQIFEESIQLPDIDPGGFKVSLCGYCSDVIFSPVLAGSVETLISHAASIVYFPDMPYSKESIFDVFDTDVNVKYLVFRFLSDSDHSSFNVVPVDFFIGEHPF